MGDEVKAIVEDWLTWLNVEKLWGLDDPLFPAMLSEQNANQEFQKGANLSRIGWQGASSICRIFRDAFTAAGLSYFNPIACVRRWG